MGTEKRQRAVKKRKNAAEKLKKSQPERTVINPKPKHKHYYHEEVVAALDKAAKMLNPPISYAEAKHRFVYEQNIEITTAFWEAFRQDNRDIEPTGVDYCHMCHKFIIHHKKYPHWIERISSFR